MCLIWFGWVFNLYLWKCIYGWLINGYSCFSELVILVFIRFCLVMNGDRLMLYIVNICVIIVVVLGILDVGLNISVSLFLL